MQAYGEAQTRLNAERVKSLGPRFLQLIDLTAVPVATRQDVGVVTTMALLDIIGRVEVPPLAAVPDAGFFDDEASAQWRLPGTPLKIVRIDEGAREGEFLLSERTVELAPAFYARIQHLPLRSKLSIESWSETLPQLHGPLIPASLIAALPELFRRTWLDTPVWKLLATLGLSGLAVLLLLGWHRFVHRALRGRSALGVYRLLPDALRGSSIP
jgi:MscS family membrane protein